MIMYWFLLACAVVGFGLVIRYALYDKKLTPKPESSQQHLLFMSAAIDERAKLLRRLEQQVTDRSVEITKADGRFLVTPDDMHKAYEEIIREEHM